MAARRARPLLVAILAATAAGCAALPFSGVAIEVGASATGLSPTPRSGANATDGTGTAVIASIALEIDYIRTAGMGAGLAYLSTTVPRSDDGPTRTGSLAAQYDVSSAFTQLANDALRPRLYAGVFLGGQGEDNSVYGAYTGVGGSFHIARGQALHLFTGPQAMSVKKGDELGASLSYAGAGWFVRARYYRSFFASCDVLPSVAAEQIAVSGGRPVRCE